MENNELESEIKSGNHSPLKVEPENIYFGSLKPGKGGNMPLKVTGGPGEVVIHNDRLKVTPSNFGNEDTEIQVELLGGPAGELMWDNIVFKGEIGEVSVLVTARWEGFPSPETPAIIAPAIELNEAPALSGTQELTVRRPWVGRKCMRCHKNFSYDANVHNWEQCHCNWYQIAINISLRIIDELRYGIKDFPSFAKETWNVILGKEKW
jgi:hypothetical protein